MMKKTHKKQHNTYEKYGYIFIAPFFITYGIFGLFPLLSTIYYSFFEYRYQLLNKIGPNFVGFDNYIQLLTTDFFDIFGNTFIIWIIGFLPQIIISLLLALWFTDTRLKLKGQGFFKSVIYMPNLVMASAFSMIFYLIFQQNGPVVAVLLDWGWLSEEINLLNYVWSSRALIALMNILMWTGNTTILLMAGIMGIDPTLIEAAEVDGASRIQIFFKIIMPLLKPIFVFVLITSLLGGLQMYDIPQILTNGQGSPNRSNLTLMMKLQNMLTQSRNYGMAGALSVLLFMIGGGLSLIIFRTITKSEMVNLDKVGGK